MQSSSVYIPDGVRLRLAAALFCLSQYTNSDKMRYVGRTPDLSLLVCTVCGDWFELPWEIEADACVDCSLRSPEQIPKFVSGVEFFQSVGLS